MKTNLSSQITLNRVSPRYYRPENAFERSVLTRLEKIPTDIYESAEEGANQIALDIAQMIRDKQKAGTLLCIGTGWRQLTAQCLFSPCAHAQGRGTEFPQCSGIQPLRILSVSFRRCEQQPQFFKGNAARPRRH